MEHLRANFLSSLVVFVIAVPLSIAIAVASGMPPSAGIISTVIGGIVIGLLAGAPLTVSGPAAGLTAIVFSVGERYGTGGLAVITVLAGLMQLAMGLLRCGRLFSYIPRAVLEGVLSAIGLIIILRQIDVFLGLPRATTLLDAVMGPFHHTPVFSVALLGFLTLLIFWGWARWSDRLDWIPGALPAVAIVTAVGLKLDVPRIHLDNFVPYIIHSRQGFAEAWHTLKFLPLLSSALAIAIVASAETLLTARSIDLLMTSHKDYMPSSLNTELRAQGIGNIFAGGLGGTPVTAVMVRSAANVNAGATNRLSTILHGLWIALFVMFFPVALEKIPLTVLAAVLISIGSKLLNLGTLWRECRHDPPQGVTWLATLVTTIFTDLLVGMVVGLVFSVIFKVLGKFRTRGGPNPQTGHT
jgi:MFS superfamily sulfate permease-like transporter